jgi:cytoskeletal protein RodZ
MSGHVSDDERDLRGSRSGEPSAGASEHSTPEHSTSEHSTSEPPLGATLRAAREERGMSVLDVSRSINLRETVVRAIEADDFTLCGGDVYARGHLRAYARLVGLDAASLVRSYDERTGAPPEGARMALLEDDDVPLERGRPNWALLVGAALVVVVALLGWQLVGELRGPARPTQPVAGTTAPPVTAPTGTSTSTPRPTDTPSSTAPAAGTPTNVPTTPPTTAVPGQVAVTLKLTDDSWVEVRDAKGRTVYSGLLARGDAKRFSDDAPLRLTLGNAGGVELTVNGTSLGAAGKAGEVKRLTFRPGEVAQLS